MASQLLKPTRFLWFRRCCVSIGGSGSANCAASNPPRGVWDMQYFAEATGDYKNDGEYDVYSNIKVHMWLEANENGYMSVCPQENGRPRAGCTNENRIAVNKFASGTMWQTIWTWDSTYGQYSQDIGTWTLDGVISVKAGETAYLTLCRSYSCDKWDNPVQVRLTKPDIDYTECVAPTISSLSCGATSPTAGSITVNGTWGKNINKSGVDIATNSQVWTLTPGNRTGSGTTISGLQPNSEYSVSVIRSNGCSSSATRTCSFTTLCGNTLSNCRALSSTELAVDLLIDGGYGKYEPTTGFRYRVSGQLGWNTAEFTTKTKTKTTATISGLVKDTYYEIQAFTTTTAGTYYGNTVLCRTAAGIYAAIDSAEVKSSTTAEVCYSWQADCAPVTTKLYYRVKNGFDPTWLEVPAFTSNNKTGTHCVTLRELVPNYTVYECYVHADGCNGEATDSSYWEFTTPALEKPDNYNCETLMYMLDLICQALEAIKEGNRTIYANQESKERCDPYSENPTMTTFWSRFNRWAGAVACLACDMVDFIIKSGKKDQYFAAELGWVNTLTEIKDNYDEDDDDQYLLPQSQAVYKFVQKSIHAVWHFHCSVDYIFDKRPNAADYPLDTVIIDMSDNKLYFVSVNGSGTSKRNVWIQYYSSMFPDNFAVYHIRKGSTSETLGVVKPDSAYYYFEGTWNNLNSDIGDVADRLEPMEKENTVIEEASHGEMQMKVVDTDFDIENDACPESGKTVYVVTEPEGYEPVYHTVKFVTNGTVIREQKVVHGAMAQKPTITPEKANCVFDGWVKKGDEIPPVEPIYKVEFDAGGVFVNPEPQIVFNGQTATLPDMPETVNGAYLAGWYIDDGTGEPEGGCPEDPWW